MPQNSDSYEAVDQKVLDIFTELVGERSSRLDGRVVAAATMDAITTALASVHGTEKAADIAFHMADWNSDSAFMTALHLFPERFTAAEIKAGIGMFLTHAPNHIRAVCGLTGEYVWENFPDADEGCSGDPG